MPRYLENLNSPLKKALRGKNWNKAYRLIRRNQGIKKADKNDAIGTVFREAYDDPTIVSKFLSLLPTWKQINRLRNALIAKKWKLAKNILGSRNVNRSYFLQKLNQEHRDRLFLGLFASPGDPENANSGRINSLFRRLN